LLAAGLTGPWPILRAVAQAQTGAGEAPSGEQGSSKAKRRAKGEIAQPRTPAVTGTAAWLERIEFPLSAVFEAELEDISRADAPAISLGRTTMNGPFSSPILFRIEYDPTKIDRSKSYAVRARLLVDGKLVLTTDRIYPVLSRGRGPAVELLLHGVVPSLPPAEPRFEEAPDSSAAGASPSPSSEAALGAHGLRLPATFRGDLPCADCAGIRHHLDLWPDQVFHLRREWLGKDFVRDEIGLWRVDPARRALLLKSGAETPLQFEILEAGKLRQLDLEGRPIESKLPYELVSDGTLAPVEVSLTMGGEMVYLADAARFTECLTGRSYPVAQESDYAAMESAYLESAPAPGAPLYVTLEGTIANRPPMEGTGLQPTLVITRFIHAWPGQACERARADASLMNTCWRIVELSGAEVVAAEKRREPHLLLKVEEGRLSFAATVGCNAMHGDCAIDGEKISFSAVASTRMACPPPLDEMEQRLADMLIDAQRWQIVGSTLELLNDAGERVALFEAVYF